MKKGLVIASLTLISILWIYVLTTPRIICNVGNKQMCLNSIETEKSKNKEKVYQCKYIAKLGL